MHENHLGAPGMQQAVSRNCQIQKVLGISKKAAQCSPDVLRSPFHQPHKWLQSEMATNGIHFYKWQKCNILIEMSYISENGGSQVTMAPTRTARDIGHDDRMIPDRVPGHNDHEVRGQNAQGQQQIGGQDLGINKFKPWLPQNWFSQFFSVSFAV